MVEKEEKNLQYISNIHILCALWCHMRRRKRGRRRKLGGIYGVLYRYWKNLVWLIYLFHEKYSIIFSTFLIKTFKHIMWWFCIITLIIKQCSCLKINFLAFHSGHLTTFFVCLCSRKLNFLAIQLTKKYKVKLITSVQFGLNYFWLF